MRLDCDCDEGRASSLHEGGQGQGAYEFGFATTNADDDVSADPEANVVQFAAWGGESEDPLDEVLGRCAVLGCE